LEPHHTREENAIEGTLIALAALSLFSLATLATAQDGRRHDSDWRRNHHRSSITVDVGRSYARSLRCEGYEDLSERKNDSRVGFVAATNFAHRD
jgi:hypothetical protein